MKKNSMLFVIGIVSILLTSTALAGDRSRSHYQSYDKHHHSSSCGHSEYRERVSRYSPSVNRFARSNNYDDGRHIHNHGKHVHKSHKYHRNYRHDYRNRHDHHDNHDAVKWLAGGILLSEVIHYSLH